MNPENAKLFSSPKKNQRFWAAVGIFILALIIRAAYWAYLQQNYFFADHPSSDVLYYQQWARAIRTNDLAALQQFYGLPLYPHILAVLQNLCLYDPIAIHVVHLLFGAANCVLLFLLADAVFAFPVAILAGILGATNFTLVFYDWLMMPVTVLITLGLILCLALARKEVVNSSREWFILGSLTGLAACGDAKFLFFFSIVTVSLFFRSCKISIPPFTKRIMIPWILGFILIIGALTLRSHFISGGWSLISPQGGLSLYAGNNPDATGVFENPEYMRPTHTGQDEDQKIIAQRFLGRTLSTTEVSQFWQAKAWDFIRQNPSAFGKLLLVKTRLFFTDSQRGHDPDLLLQNNEQARLDINPFFIICPLAIFGWLAIRPRPQNLHVVDFLILCQFLTTLIFFHSTRHRASILPFLLMYEAYFLWWAYQQIKTKKFILLVASVLFLAGFMLGFPREPINPAAIEFLRHAKTGAIYTQKQRYPDAIREYEKALALRPGDSNSLYNLGTTYLLAGNVSLAQQYLKAALKIVPANVDALFNLGFTYEQTQDWPAALQTYQQILTDQPQGTDVLFRIANVYQSQGNCEMANKYWDQVLVKEPLLKDSRLDVLGPCSPATKH